MFQFVLFLCLSITSAVVPVYEVPRETTTTVLPPRRGKSTMLTDAFVSSSISPLIPFDEFANTLDAIFFTGYTSNMFSRFPELILGKSQNISTIQMVQRIDYSRMIDQVDVEYQRRGVNVSEIFDETFIESLFGKVMVTALEWRTNPPILLRDGDDVDFVDGLSEEKFLRHLNVNAVVIERVLTSLGSSPELEYILIKFLLRDSQRNQARYANCLKLIEESPVFEFASQVWPEMNTDLQLYNHTVYKLERVLVNTFRMFNMTSFDVSQKTSLRVKEYLPPKMIFKLYHLPVDEYFQLVIGNFHANALKKLDPRRPSGIRDMSWLDRVYIGKDVDMGILEELKTIVGYNPFEGRLDQIGFLDDRELANKITQKLVGAPNRRQIIGVLLGWIRESLKVIVNRSLITVIE